MRKKLGRSTNLVHDEAPPLPAGTPIFDCAFPSTSETKNEALDALLGTLRNSGGCDSDSDETRLRLVLDEALVNALMHGNKFDAGKQVRVRAFLGKAKWCVLIEDQGAGFREEDLPDPDAAENMLEESGRGVHL